MRRALSSGRLVLWSALTSLALAVAPCAEATTRVSPVVSGAHAQTRADNDLPADFGGELGHGAGLLLGFSLGKSFELETGGIYQLNLYNQIPAGVSLPKDVWALQIPALLRYWLGNILSLGAGPFYSISFTDGAPDDWGFTASLGLAIPFSQSFGLRFDGRYNAGFKDLTGDKPGYQASASTQVLAGLQFRF